MSSIVNYLFEANLILLFALAIYNLLLKKETDFTLVRMLMLGSVVASLTFPLIHFTTTQPIVIPQISDIVPPRWLPEVTISPNDPEYNFSLGALNFWDYTVIVYLLGIIVALLKFLFEIYTVFGLVRGRIATHVQKVKLIEVEDNIGTFSFFNMIFIGNADSLTQFEKEVILAHERVHARQWHSLDIILLRITKIIFWFNPFINTYKKIFVQLHEFEADARAARSQDVDKYCNLLARVALQNAGLSLGNHFNNSLTIKRIDMMRTLKSKIRRWKLAVIALLFPVVFFAIACQDQIAEQTSAVPAEAASKFEAFKKQYPGANVMIETNEETEGILGELEMTYGKAQHIEITTITDTEGRVREFYMLQFAKRDYEQEEVQDVVEQMPEFKGGMQAMTEFLQSNISYPTQAKEAGIEGTVFAEFIVEPDGKITNINIKRSVDPAIDAETLRVIKLMPEWKPGINQQRTVRTRLVLPVKFAI